MSSINIRQQFRS